MARKSRKNLTVPAGAAVTVSSEEKNFAFHAAVYARISMETEQTQQSGTIDVQIELIKNYVKDSEDIEIVDVYADSDYSGTNFDRPEFTRMMEDIKHGRINCVIVKDLSRLGRNYVETSNFIERVFPFFHVRFIAVTDDFDSFREGVDLTIPLKNIINEFYSRDLAKKSSSAKRALAQSGKFVGAWEPYGYRKAEDNKYQLLVDETLREHVKNIFQWYMDGENYSAIAKRLNADGVLSPALQRKFYRTGEIQVPQTQPWNNYEVKRVLMDRHVLGCCVYGKFKQSVFVNNSKQRQCPEEEWMITENTHEAIIDREMFGQVQIKIAKVTEAFKKRHGSNNGETKKYNFYTGKITCGGCGNRMVLGKEKSGVFYYRCGANTNHKAGGNECKDHRVKKEYLDEEVWRLIRSHMKMALETEQLIRNLNTTVKNQNRYQIMEKEVSRLRRELSRINKRKGNLYEDYSERLITEEEYLQFSNIYACEIEKIKKQMDLVLAEQVRYSKEFHLDEGWEKTIHTYLSKRKLTAEMADAFVDSIVIHSKYDYEIHLVYDDLFMDLEKLKKEKVKEVQG